MKEKETTPDPRSLDYQAKNRLIGMLNKSNTDDAQTSRLLDSFSIAIEANPLLSAKQRQELLFALQKPGLLDYQRSYFTQLDIAESEGKLAEVENRLKANLDYVAWDMENRGKLQVDTLIAASKLTRTSRTEYRIQIISDLFNAAHLASRKQTFDLPYDPEQYQKSIDKYELVEEDVFDQRAVYLKQLSELGMVGTDELEDLQDLDRENFVAEREVFDQVLALHFLSKFNGRTTARVFSEFQQVIYAGFALGVRDANAAYERLRNTR